MIRGDAKSDKKAAVMNRSRAWHMMEPGRRAAALGKVDA